MATLLGAIVLPVNLRAFPRLALEAEKLPPAARPRVSVVIPARDEAAGIERTVRSHLAQDYPDLHVVVVDDRSTDATGEIVAAIAREDARVRLVRGAEPPEGWLGKPHALWQGAREADGDFLLFADGDVRYHPRALSEAMTVMEGRQLDLLAFFPRLEGRGFWENVLMPYLAEAVFLGLGFLARFQRCPIALGAGAGNLVRRRAYERVGGHQALRDSVVDDVRLAGTVKRAGFRVGAFRAEDRVFVRMYDGFRGVWNGFTKNIAWIYSGFVGIGLFGLTVSAARRLDRTRGRPGPRGGRRADSAARRGARRSGLRVGRRSPDRPRGSARKSTLARNDAPYNDRRLGRPDGPFPVSKVHSKAPHLAGSGVRRASRALLAAGFLGERGIECAGSASRASP